VSNFTLGPGKVMVPRDGYKLFAEEYMIRRRFRIVFNYDKEILGKLGTSKLWKLVGPVMDITIDR
jgi:hypothetical protein